MACLKATPTKIICTLGPKSDSEETIKELVTQGMDIARVNFSHGDLDYHQRIFAILNRIRNDPQYATLAVAVDTKGPEIRTGMFVSGKATIQQGSCVRLSTETKYQDCGTAEVFYIDHQGIFKDLAAMPAKSIFIDDGKLELVIESINAEQQEIVTRAANSYEISSRKGVNIPGTDISLPNLTDKDRQDIQFGIDNGADFIFASFVRTKECLAEIRALANSDQIKIIAKIESEEGIKNLKEIVEASDGIMIARGDLGIEVPYSRLFALQCSISQLCRELNKPFIVATQMLESTTQSLRPTRAEITDVGFATATGAACVMLSGETAAGICPPNSVKIMKNILVATAEDLLKTNSTSPIFPIPNSQPEITMVSSNNLKFLRHTQLFYAQVPVYSSKESPTATPTVPQGYAQQLKQDSANKPQL
ncbi:pyruvate kinase [Nematocida homosporus]|uniref:pyruvate kinase n=1 Tax=Nematocida homosporus TaxID=1912981 RepID=UPI00221FB982|nr:pyruvate kinase [Nematocida homosporus]KAI5184616.1 pyruvate kinase [Nematocida homosporus]